MTWKTTSPAQIWSTRAQVIVADCQADDWLRRAENSSVTRKSPGSPLHVGTTIPGDGTTMMRRRLGSGVTPPADGRRGARLAPNVDATQRRELTASPDPAPACNCRMLARPVNTFAQPPAANVQLRMSSRRFNCGTLPD